MVSSAASREAHVTQSTPRSSGSRDFGSVGYGCAPVKRRFRPVTDGGVGARFVDSLIDGPQEAAAIIAMTTGVMGRARDEG